MGKERLVDTTWRKFHHMSQRGAKVPAGNACCDNKIVRKVGALKSQAGAQREEQTDHSVTLCHYKYVHYRHNTKPENFLQNPFKPEQISHQQNIAAKDFSNSYAYLQSCILL